MTTTTVTSINSPAPAAWQALSAAIEAAVQQYGEAAVETSRAWLRYDKAIECRANTRRVNRLELVAKLRAVRQSIAYHALDMAKAWMLEQAAAPVELAQA